MTEANILQSNYLIAFLVKKNNEHIHKSKYYIESLMTIQWEHFETNKLIEFLMTKLFENI